MEEVKKLQSNFEEYERQSLALGNIQFHKDEVFKNRVCRCRNCKERGLRYTHICKERCHSSFYMK